MKQFETAIQVVANDLRNTIKEDHNDLDIESWSEMLNAFGLDSSDIKEEIRYILNKYENYNNISLILTDDL